MAANKGDLPLGVFAIYLQGILVALYGRVDVLVASTERCLSYVIHPVFRNRVIFCDRNWALGLVVR